MSLRTKLGLGGKASTTGFTPRANIPRSDVQGAVEYVMDNAENVGTVYAPTDAQYLTSASASGLSNERVVTDTATITWDFATLGQAKANWAHLGLQSLSDPGADRGMFWDDSEGAVKFFTPASGLAFVGTNLSITDPDLTAIINESGFAQGDILYHNGTTLARLAAGTDGQFLRTRGASAAPEWESIAGGGDMLRANNLSDLDSAATSRENLGVEIGVDVQAWDAQLDSLSAASADGVSLVTAANYAAMRALLDLEAGTDFYSIAAANAAFQPIDADLTSWAGVTRAAGFDTFAATPSSANLAALVTGETGSGALVFATSPTLVTPALGTPSSGTLTSCTGLPVSTGISGLGTGVATFLATPSSANLAAAVTGETGSGALVFATSPTLVTPALGTPSSGTLTSCTGLPISTGVSGLGTGVATFLATPSSANLLAAVTDETGTGALVFATSPTFVTPALGTPASGTLTNCTGLPLTGLVGDTTTALGIGSINLGHASDTTLTRVSAGVVAIEGVNILTTATGQPLDGDLTALAALSGTDTIYYRSGASTWTAVTIGANLTFSGGTLSATGGGGGVSDGDKGDITVSGTGATWTIDNDAVTYGKIQNASANVVLTRAAGSSGDIGETALSASQLLGRGATGDVAAITLGTNLSMSGTTLNASGGLSRGAVIASYMRSDMN